MTTGVSHRRPAHRAARAGGAHGARRGLLQLGAEDAVVSSGRTALRHAQETLVQQEERQEGQEIEPLTNALLRGSVMSPAQL